MRTPEERATIRALQAKEGAIAMAEYLARDEKIRLKIERLKAARLAKLAATDAPAVAKSAVAKPHVRGSREMPVVKPSTLAAQSEKTRRTR